MARSIPNADDEAAPHSVWQVSCCGDGAAHVQQSAVLQRLEDLSLRYEVRRVRPGPSPRFGMDLVVELETGSHELSIDLIDQLAAAELVGTPWPGLSLEAAAPGWVAPFAWRVDIELGADAGRAFGAQFRILAALCPNAPFVLDCDTSTVYRRSWLGAMLADGPVANLAKTIAIHDVYEPGGHTHWIHTHGMERLERVDLDLLDVPAETVEFAGPMLLSLVELFLEPVWPRPRQLVQLDPTLAVCWVPWQEARELLDPPVMGGPREDGVHGGKRGVLLSAELRNLASAISVATQAGQQVVQARLAADATEQMRRRARERWPLCVALFDAYAGHAELCFLVKLRFEESPGNVMHYWLHLDDFGQDWIDATRKLEPGLIGAPLGQRREYPLARMTDWAIHYRDTFFSSDMAEELERRLIEDGVEADD